MAKMNYWLAASVVSAVVAGCGRIGFEFGDDASGDPGACRTFPDAATPVCPGTAPDAGVAPGMLRVTVTADQGYTLVSRSGAGPLVAQPAAWNPTTAEMIYFECEEYELPSDTTELYAVAGNSGSAQALYLHAELDGVRMSATSGEWETCDTGVPRIGTQPSDDVAAFVAEQLPLCTWTSACEIPYVINPLCSCDRAAGIHWVWGAATNNWQLFRAPAL